VFEHDVPEFFVGLGDCTEQLVDIIPRLCEVEPSFEWEPGFVSLTGFPFRTVLDSERLEIIGVEVFFIINLSAVGLTAFTDNVEVKAGRFEVDCPIFAISGTFS
jgi:hypothetical protein